MPPKFAALATYPWLELDAASRAALASYDGTAATFAFSWAANNTVSGQDTFRSASPTAAAAIATAAPTSCLATATPR